MFFLFLLKICRLVNFLSINVLQMDIDKLCLYKESILYECTIDLYISSTQSNTINRLLSQNSITKAYILK